MIRVLILLTALISVIKGFTSAPSFIYHPSTRTELTLKQGSKTPRWSSSLSASKSTSKQLKREEWADKRSTTESTTESNTALQPCTVVGGGRIGELLMSSSTDNKIIGRNDDMDNLPSGPIYVCTRNDALNDVVERCPSDRRGDLVFLQNGYIEDWLNSKGLSDNTQILLFLAVTAKGANPIDGVTTVNPEGLTAVTGKWGSDFKARLNSMNLKCNVLDKTTYDKKMYEKMFWICTMMLVGAAKGCDTVGDAKRDHGELVGEVVSELAGSVSEIEFESGLEDRLNAYTDVVSTFPAAVKEFEWRNKVFYDKQCTIHNGLLEECVEKGVFAFP
ncbi:hypothetical protein TrLO_g8721 [Triparma laevis f. longispina]|uniref:Uncharacterized protein n=1 Tax=Triparma laevis f. longispina TaxID=1714387 RepID=A0A9W7E008_9STRA|nr:hypothetical protein TrLO_g8721 [Triparma laevis f. longispina]